MEQTLLCQLVSPNLGKFNYLSIWQHLLMFVFTFGLEVERAQFFRARAELELQLSSPDEPELSNFPSRAFSEPR